MNKEEYEKNLKEIQAAHLRMVRQMQGINWQPCAHDSCQNCVGTGVRRDGSVCVHGLYCPCPKHGGDFGPYKLSDVAKRDYSCSWNELKKKYAPKPEAQEDWNWEKEYEKITTSRVMSSLTHQDVITNEWRDTALGAQVKNLIRVALAHQKGRDGEGAWGSSCPRQSQMDKGGEGKSEKNNKTLETCLLSRKSCQGRCSRLMGRPRQ